MALQEKFTEKSYALYRREKNLVASSFLSSYLELCENNELSRMRQLIGFLRALQCMHTLMKCKMDLDYHQIDILLQFFVWANKNQFLRILLPLYASKQTLTDLNSREFEIVRQQILSSFEYALVYMTAAEVSKSFIEPLRIHEQYLWREHLEKSLRHRDRMKLKGPDVRVAQESSKLFRRAGYLVGGPDCPEGAGYLTLAEFFASGDPETTVPFIERLIESRNK